MFLSCPGQIPGPINIPDQQSPPSPCPCCVITVRQKHQLPRGFPKQPILWRWWGEKAHHARARSLARSLPREIHLQAEDWETLAPPQSPSLLPVWVWRNPCSPPAARETNPELGKVSSSSSHLVHRAKLKARAGRSFLPPPLAPPWAKGGPLPAWKPRASKFHRDRSPPPRAQSTESGGGGRKSCSPCKITYSPPVAGMLAGWLLWGAALPSSLLAGFAPTSPRRPHRRTLPARPALPPLPAHNAWSASQLHSPRPSRARRPAGPPSPRPCQAAAWTLRDRRRCLRLAKIRAIPVRVCAVQIKA